MIYRKPLVLLLLASCACFFAACTPDQPAEPASNTPRHNTLTEAEAAAGWQLLFDGESTEAWRRYNGTAFPDSGWFAEAGLLVVTGGGGDIITRESFASFELTLEFQLSPEANSGIFYRVWEEEGRAIWQNAPEYQVLDDPFYVEKYGEAWSKTHLTGENYDLHSATVRPLKPMGEWNEARILVDGNQVTHWLNGEQTITYVFGSEAWESLVAASKFAEYPNYGRAESGPIGLQDHGNRIAFRNLKIRPF